jgi:hypothetical protein
MEELQVPTHSIDVEIHTDDGKQLQGLLYAAERRYVTGEFAKLVHLLNDERNFLPFQAMDPGGRKRRHVILNKDHIVRVRLSSEAASATGVGTKPEDQGESPGENTVVLTDGTCLVGRVVVETPRSQSRLVDKLNHAERFIPIISDESVDFVQRDHVLRLD